MLQEKTRKDDVSIAKNSESKESIQLVYDMLAKPQDDISIPKFLYHSRNGWKRDNSGRLEN